MCEAFCAALQVALPCTGHDRSLSASLHLASTVCYRFLWRTCVCLGRMLTNMSGLAMSAVQVFTGIMKESG